MNALATTVRIPLTLRANDGVALDATLFRADAPRAAVLIAGALATRHAYYRRFASWLADRGYSTLTFDYRGIGGSRAGSLRGYPGTLQDWGRRDVEAALAALREHTPDVPVFVIGHSFGGQSLALSDGLAQADGLITIGAQLGYLGHWEGAAVGAHVKTRISRRLGRVSVRPRERPLFTCPGVASDRAWRGRARA